MTVKEQELIAAGAALMEARQRAGYTQFQLGLLIHPPISPNTICRYEAGTRPISPIVAAKLGRVLGLEPERIAHGTGLRGRPKGAKNK